MRVQNKAAAVALLAGKSYKSKNGSISCNGQTVYSYATAIAHKLPDGTILLNPTKYSPTTSRQQGDLRYYFSLQNAPTVTVNGCFGRGISGYTLADAFASGLVAV